MKRCLTFLPCSLLMAAIFILAGCYIPHDENTGTLRVLTFNMLPFPTARELRKAVTETVETWPSLARWDIVLLRGDEWFAEEMTVWTPLPHKTKPRTLFDPARNSLTILARNYLYDDFRLQWTQCLTSLATQPACPITAGFTYARMHIANDAWLGIVNVRLLDEDISDPGNRSTNSSQLIEFVSRWTADDALIVGGDIGLESIGDSATEFAQVLTETGLIDACEATGCAVARRQHILFRDSVRISLRAQMWDIVKDLSAADSIPPVRDEPIEVQFSWSVTSP